MNSAPVEVEASTTPGDHEFSGHDVVLGRVRALIAKMGSAIVAYSGGVDSALVLAIAHEQLGARALGCIGVSPSYPRREQAAAVALAEQIGARYRLVNTQEHLDARYAANPSNRCYFCKSELYARLSSLAVEERVAVILDGTNASDLDGHRPGYRAAQEKGVRSPLAELDISKEQVRALAQAMGLPVWDKPASPCLASRVPTGTAVDPELLHKIEAAEDVLVRMGFREFRVRHHGDIARLELRASDHAIAMARHTEILAGIRAAGYRFVCLDLAGFRSGSLNVLQ